MNVFIPHDMIIKAQRYKYKYLAIPAGIVIVSFFLKSISEDAKWASLLGLVVYALVLIVFRFKGRFGEADEGEVLAPINGKVLSINEVEKGCVVTIQKLFFGSSEIVTCTKSDVLNKIDMESERVCWKVECANMKVFTDAVDVNYQAVLVGLAPGTAVCEVFVPKQYNLIVNEGDVIEAGMTVLAEIEINDVKYEEGE